MVWTGLVTDGPDEVDVIVEDERWGSHALGNDLARAVMAALNSQWADGLHGTVTVLLTDDAGQRRLNVAHRGIDRTTDVLSFPAHPHARDAAARRHVQGGDRPPLGDISLAYETVARDAEGEGVTIRDHALHLAVHGTLHLLGATHDGAADAAAMETAETRILAGLGVADPYA